MFSGDRRCRNLIHTPGSPLCYFHANPRRKKPASAPDHPAARAFFQWLAAHPLDSVTHVNQAVNLIVLLLAGNRISVRRADSLLRMTRVLMKSVPEVREEFGNEWFRRHWSQGDRFLQQAQAVLAAATPAAPDPSPDPAPGSTPVVAAPPLPLEAAASGTGFQPVNASVPTQDSTASTPQGSTTSARPIATVSPNHPAHSAPQIPSPSSNPTPPAPSGRASQAAASPHRDPLAPFVEKHLPTLIRALLSDAGPAPAKSRTRPASAPRDPASPQRAGQPLPAEPSP
jgi:hypothetical protein